MSTTADRPNFGRTRVRVRYPETDRMGVAYHAHYLVWFEIGRTELLRALGSSYAEMEEDQGIFLPVTEIGVRYRRSAGYDDELLLETRLEQVGGSRVRFSYRLVRLADDQELATGFSEHATVGEDRRPRRMPAELRQQLLAARATQDG